LSIAASLQTILAIDASFLNGRPAIILAAAS
jgi:hypothetical protein